MYISWPTTVKTAPIRQLVGIKRISLLSPSKSVNVKIKLAVERGICICITTFSCIM